MSSSSAKKLRGRSRLREEDQRKEQELREEAQRKEQEKGGQKQESRVKEQRQWQLKREQHLDRLFEDHAAAPI